MPHEDKKQTIAVFTSGGDAPGMNAVVRAVVRTGIARGHDVYAIYEGYEGLVAGGDFIKKMEWNDVSMIIHKGGTIIGSARCMKFRERDGRLQAAENLLKRKITNLICCGGDGSLTGANLFKLEWTSLLEELVQKGRASKEDAEACSFLNLVGTVGSIDNDMVYDGELTIGTDTALHRIVEAIDAVTTTAASHLRTFVMEVMGRHCGYLAWAAAIACGADFVLIPESPPEMEDWETVMCNKLEKRRKKGQRLCLVIVAEGAIDKNGKDIKAEYVKDVIVQRLKHDTRVTVLGHVQRGGQTSAYDRLMATITSSAAVEKVLQAKKGEPATIVGLQGTKCIYAPLVESVQETQKVAKFTEARDFAAAIKQRGKDFDKDYEFHKAINGTDVRLADGHNPDGRGVAILHCGAPAAGMNGATRAAARYLLNFGYKVYGVQNGFEGFETGLLSELDWMQVSAWANDGGSRLGTNRKQPSNVQAIIETVKKFKLVGIIVIGGFEALTAMIRSKELRQQYPEIAIPAFHIPVTISNNVPGTDWSLGCDTALNAICDAIDRTKVSAEASRHRVFLVETQGAKCGFLAAMGALAAGAHRAFIPEERASLKDIKLDIDMVRRRIGKGGNYSVIVKTDGFSDSYTLDTMYKLYREESKGDFSVRECSLGHLCQGLYPSPLDRVRSARLAAFAVHEILNEVAKGGQPSCATVGFKDGKIIKTEVDVLAKETDFKNRVWKHQWFLRYTPLIRLLARYDFSEDAMAYNPKEMFDL